MVVTARHFHPSPHDVECRLLQPYRHTVVMKPSPAPLQTEPPFSNSSGFEWKEGGLHASCFATMGWWDLYHSLVYNAYKEEESLIFFLYIPDLGSERALTRYAIVSPLFMARFSIF